MCANAVGRHIRVRNTARSEVKNVVLKQLVVKYCHEFDVNITKSGVYVKLATRGFKMLILATKPYILYRLQICLCRFTAKTLTL